MLSLIHTRWCHFEVSLWYLSILSYLIPYTAVGNCAGQLFLALKIFTFPLGPSLRAHAKVILSSHSFQHITLEQQVLTPRQNPMGFGPNMPDGKFPLSPGIPATPQALPRPQDVHVGDKGHPCWGGCAGAGAASVHSSLSMSQLLSFSSSVLHWAMARGLPALS